jgi:phosphoglycolate phosphatase
LIVFDLDGTLVDSRRDIADSTNLLLEQNGAAPLSEAVVGKMVGDGAAALVRRAFAAAATEPPADALERFLNIYATRLLIHTRPYDGIADLLRTVGPGRQLAVLTNKPAASTREILDGLGLSRFFDPDAVVCGDSRHGRKPAPDGLNWLMQQAQVESAETLVVGDSVIDWQTAMAAGTTMCFAGYGFGFESVPEQVAREACVIGTPLELMNYVMNEYG